MDIGGCRKLGIGLTCFVALASCGEVQVGPVNVMAYGADGPAGPGCGNGIVDPGEMCDGDCPTSCDDGASCTTDELTGSADKCDVECKHTDITQCNSGDGCCPSGCNHNNDTDCSASCGNGVIDIGETCDPSSNCPMSCDDGTACTADSTIGSKNNCNLACRHDAITMCKNGDGCCPAGCNHNNDTDCSASCGNGVVESGETCDPPSSCPSSCSDGKTCTSDIQTGSPSTCNIACSHQDITMCKSGDGCCAPGCNLNTDGDCMNCPAGFGNCDGNPSNGCESNLATDSNNCGACGQRLGEACDGKDNNCDGRIDEGCPIPGPVTWTGSTTSPTWGRQTSATVSGLVAPFQIAIYTSNLVNLLSVEGMAVASDIKQLVVTEDRSTIPYRYGIQFPVPNGVTQAIKAGGSGGIYHGMVCPAGFLTTGVSGTAGNEVEALGITCSRILLLANPWRVAFDTAQPQPAVGGWGSPYFSFDCPAGAMIGGVTMSQGTSYIGDGIVNSISFSCMSPLIKLR